jgi:hypothetical protein
VQDPKRPDLHLRQFREVRNRCYNLTIIENDLVNLTL